MEFCDAVLNWITPQTAQKIVPLQNSSFSYVTFKVEILVKLLCKFWRFIYQIKIDITCFIKITLKSNIHILIHDRDHTGPLPSVSVSSRRRQHCYSQKPCLIATPISTLSLYRIELYFGYVCQRVFLNNILKFHIEIPPTRVLFKAVKLH